MNFHQVDGIDGKLMQTWAPTSTTLYNPYRSLRLTHSRPI